MANLRIKKGLYSNIGKLQDGDLGFAKYDNSNGTIVIKDGENLIGIMPAPGVEKEKGLPLLGKGPGNSPAYDILGISGGGTGVSTIVANRLLYINENKFNSSGHYIDSNLIAINSTTKPAENLYVNGNSKFNGNILPNLTTHTIGSSTARWNTLYVNTLMARNGNSVISEQDYETDCNTDCMIRIDSHINKGKDYNLNFSALPPYGNNANTLITVNRHGGNYITQLGLTSKGIFYRLGEAAVPTKDKEWNQLIYKEVKTGSGFSAVGSATLPVYVNTDGKVVACAADSVFSSLSWTAGTTKGPVLNVTITGQNRTAMIPSASNTASGIVTTVAQTFAGDKTFAGNILPSATKTKTLGSSSLYWNDLYTKIAHIGDGNTDSSSTTTGALIVNGGVGISKQLRVGGVTTISNTTDSTSTTTGALKISGGVYVAKQLRVGTNLTVSGNTTLGDENADTITINGKTILKKDVTYGTAAPSGTGTEGQIYFKVIS